MHEHLTSLGATMTRLTNILLSTLVVLIAVNSVSAKEWRGVVPLRSTRADVMRLFNECSDYKEACRFTVGTERVHILFSGGLPTKYLECAARLPPETVMFIAVQPRAKLKLSDLGLNKRRLQKFNPSNPADRHFKGYRSEEGIIVSLFKDIVSEIVYFAAESDKDGCADYYKNAESFVAVPLVHVFYISTVNAPETIRAGEKLQATAYSFMNETRGYTWTVSAGKIIAGQYTKQVTIDTTGLAGQELTVTAEIGDLFQHTTVASCVVQILPN